MYFLSVVKYATRYPHCAYYENKKKTCLYCIDISVISAFTILPIEIGIYHIHYILLYYIMMISKYFRRVENLKHEINIENIIIFYLARELCRRKYVA